MAIDLNTLTLTAAQLRKAAPAEVDERIYAASRELGMAATRQANLSDLIARLCLHRTGYSQERLDTAQAEHRKLTSWIQSLNDCLSPLQKEFTRRGGWSRAWLAITNGRGHVHQGEACPRLYRDGHGNVTTLLELVWQLSGADEAAIVEAAGERACTTCYPSAPVDVLKRATRIFSEDERAKQAAREERDVKRAAKAAKAEENAITNPDGTPLLDAFRGVIKTVRTAEMEYVDTVTNLQYYANRSNASWQAEQAEYLTRLTAALAHKYSLTVSETEARLAPKVEARRKKDAREAAKFRR
jgi:hypothetical protein